MKLFIESLLAIVVSMYPAWDATVEHSESVKEETAPPLDYLKGLPPLRERQGQTADQFSDLSPTQCRRRMKRVKERLKMFEFGKPQRGVAVPMRIKGPISGLRFRLPPTNSAFSILDCRQALLWRQEAVSLASMGFKSIHIGNFYRKGARLPKKKSRKSQHAYGLAADIIGLSLHDGRFIGVEDHFYGKLGEPVCGPLAKIHSPAAGENISIEQALDFKERATYLRNLVCSWARNGVFHHILTPNYNAAHFNHLHVDIKRSNDWFMVK